MKKLIFFSVIVLALLFSCKKSPVVPDNTVTDAMARDSLYYIMKDWYYWYNQPEAMSVTASNKANYKDPYELLEAMRYETLDRWSFVEDYNQFLADMNGTFVGHGFRIGIDEGGKARIAMVYMNSALYTAGVRRGWIIKSINGTDPAPIIIANDGVAYTNLIGKSEAGITNIFVFTKPDGSDVTISATKSTFQVNTVLLSETLQLTSGPTGHLVFDSFITPSSAELITAFAKFQADGVKDLILDLRYNSGGYLYIAQALASYIGGNGIQGSIFAKMAYNNQHPEANSTFQFINTSYSLALPRLVVITTRSTASASEAVINGLRPFVNVVCVGDTTNGKPTGMNGWAIAEKYFMWPITFKMVNASNQGDYFQGIFPDKQVSDDITHDFSDPQELCLSQAIHYLQSGSFSKSSEAYHNSHTQFSEKPSWMNNAFVLNK